MRLLNFLPCALLLLSSPLAHAADHSGLQVNTTKPATCSRPARPGDRISMNYSGKLQSNGLEFDESYSKAPIVFVLGAGKVIDGWDLGLVGMCPGEGRRLTIAPELAYGNRKMGPIPPGSTLVFDTEMVEIFGVKQDEVVKVEIVNKPSSTTDMPTTTAHGELISIATAPSTPAKSDGNEHDDTGLVATPLDDSSKSHPSDEDPEIPNAECHLLGPFALLVQGALGAVAILSLVWKRYRETPKRPWKIFFFDVSKQVFGSMLTHVLNLAMSMIGTIAIVNVAKQTAEGSAAMAAANGDDEGVRVPNPCSYYLLNLGIDTTIGIPVLYLLLKVLHAFFLRTPLARPPQSIQSGKYSPTGEPPRATWWCKQLLIYFLGLVGMKLFVFFLFNALPFLPWIGDWALRWTKGNEALEVTFAMFIFPLAMNAVQYWIIDSFIMDKTREQGYEAVHDEVDDGAGRRLVGGDPEEGDEDDDASSGSLAPESRIHVIGSSKEVSRGGSSKSSLTAKTD